MSSERERSIGLGARLLASPPWLTGVLCALLAAPARVLGHEAAQAFRRLVDHIVSRSDTLFDYASSSESAADTIRSIQAWGAWVLYGLVAGLLAMAATRVLTRRPAGWVAIGATLAIWLAVYALIWRWDEELRFISAGSSLAEGVLFGAWPYAGSFGWFGGFALGLVLAGAPCRASGGFRKSVG